MPYSTGKSLAVALLAIFVGCGYQPASAQRGAPPPTKNYEHVRPAAVAGIFYPANAADLEREVDGLLEKAKVEPIKNLRALVCPHAGYEYSAPIAAIGYKQLAGRDFSTVILLGPSHYAAFEGAFVSTADAYQTPLGMVPLSAKTAELAKLGPLTGHPRCMVQRPDWSGQSPRKPPPPGEDTPETWEHSLEVELPFLQRTLRDFTIVPIVFGDVDTRKVADRLIPLLDARTLIVVSTDLSHYHPYDEAVAQDNATVKAICDLDPAKLTADDACGYEPVLTLIDIARRKGWKAQKLDYRNSGDTSGDKSRVVGYAAIAFFDPNAATAGTSQYGPAERRLLLELARKSVAAAAAHGEPPKPEPDAAQKLLERRACFVTLTKDGQLRGCIGSIFPQEPLLQAVIRRARAAAIEDPRFPPVRPAELRDIEIEISVLSEPKPLRFTSPDDLLRKLRPGIDGVVLRAEGREGTFLPQVWDQIADRRQFMSELAAEKAGLPADAWTQPDAVVLTYQVEAFKERGVEKGEGGRGKGEKEPAMAR